MIRQRHRPSDTDRQTLERICALPAQIKEDWDIQDGMSRPDTQWWFGIRLAEDGSFRCDVLSHPRFLSIDEGELDRITSVFREAVEGVFADGQIRSRLPPPQPITRPPYLFLAKGGFKYKRRATDWHIDGRAVLSGIIHIPPNPPDSMNQTRSAQYRIVQPRRSCTPHVQIVSTKIPFYQWSFHGVVEHRSPVLQQAQQNAFLYFMIFPFSDSMLRKIIQPKTAQSTQN